MMDNRIQQMYEKTAETTCETVEARPLASVAAVFGLGLVTGLLVASLIPESRPRSSSWTDWSDWQASQFGQQMMDRLGKLAPSSWKS